MRALVVAVLLSFFQLGWAEESTGFVLLDGIEDYQTEILVSPQGTLDVVEKLKIKVMHSPKIIQHLRSFSYGKLIRPRVHLNQQELRLKKQPWYRAQAIELDQEHILGRGEHLLEVRYRLLHYLESSQTHSSLTWNAAGIRWPGLIKSAAVHITIPDYHSFMVIDANTGIREKGVDYNIAKQNENHLVLETTKCIDKDEHFIVDAAWTH